MPTRKSRTRHATSKKVRESSKNHITSRDLEILLILAKALNAADKLNPVLTHDAVYTNVGYILPVGRKRKWQVRIPTQRGS